MAEIRPTPIDAAEQVAVLPRRTAHAAYALRAYIEENTGPAHADEVVLFDREALSVHSTASALAEARRRGLVQRWPGRSSDSVLWTMTPHGSDLAGALEARYLADTKEPTDA